MNAEAQEVVNPKTGMTHTEMKNFIRDHFEQFVNRQNLGIADINFAKDFVDHGADVPPGLPPDPFADDPCDPSAALDDVEPGQPLDPQERMAVEADLADLAVYEALLAHKGVRGLVVCCDECQQDHYHDWDMLRANLLQLLVDGTVRPHEPAYDPEPDAYVTWDYCRGYADASLNEATSDSEGFHERR